MQYRKIILKEQKEKINAKNEFLNRILTLRGLVKEEEISKFLNPKKEDFVSPFAFSDMEKAKNQKIIFKSLKITLKKIKIKFKH